MPINSRGLGGDATAAERRVCLRGPLQEDEDDEGDSTQNLRWAPQHGQPPPPREELKSIATSTLQCSAETVCSKFLR